MKFSKLKEDPDLVTSDDSVESGPPSPPGPAPHAPSTSIAMSPPFKTTSSSSSQDIFLSKNARLALLAGLTVLLLVILLINTRLVSYGNFYQVSQDLNTTSQTQLSLRDELQLVSEKLNEVEANLKVVTGNYTQERLRSIVIQTQKALEDRVSGLLNNDRTRAAKVEANSRSLADILNNLQELSTNSSRFHDSVTNSLQDLHKHIDKESNKTQDFSVDFLNKHDNLWAEIEQVRHLLENAQEETEEHILQQDLTNSETNLKINILESAVNLTIQEIADSKSGHAEFKNQTMNMLNNVMEIYKKQQETEDATSRGDSSIDEVTMIDDVTTPSSGTTGPPDTCLDPKPVPQTMITCSASSSYSRKWGCTKAFDGILQTNKQGSAWASKGEGVGAWIQATFSKPIIIKEIKLLQRWEELEANREIELDFDGQLQQSAVLPAKGSRHWNVIRLSRGVETTKLKITIVEVYGTINNGFKEIAIGACF